MLGLGHQLLKRGGRAGCGTFVFCGVCAVFGNLAGLCLGVDNVQNITGLWGAIQPQNLDRYGWTCGLDPVTLVVNQGAYTAPLFADNEYIALFQCTFLNQNRGNRTASHVKLCLNHGALSGAVGVGFQF